jgi:exonuclease VII small subunit
LTVNGQTLRQPLTITLDPRVKVSQADLQSQLNAEKSISAQMSATYNAVTHLHALEAQIKERQTALAGNTQAQATLEQLNQLEKTVDDMENGALPSLGLGSLNRELARLATEIESGDAKPAAELQSGVDQYCEQTTKRLTQWKDLAASVASVESGLTKLNQPALSLDNAPPTPQCK